MKASADNGDLGLGRKPLYELCKRVFELCVVPIGLVILSPVFLAVAILIKCDSPGPVFYRGVRTGRYGKPFRIFKFRSMVVGADRGPGSTAQHDPRITRVGRFIRPHKIDELPQLLSVLLGHMSLVGPRPELPRYTEQYDKEEQIILAVRPGITDYSSIHFIQLGDVLVTDDPDRAFEENVLATKNRLRLRYVYDRSIWLDLHLVLQTLVKIGRREWNTPSSDPVISKSAD
jgi:lipopolysaccharide/colanic/teichoic acid biosynthesis glycosyltransferase